MDSKIYIDLLKNVLTDYHRIDLGEYKPLYGNNPSFARRTLMTLSFLLEHMVSPLASTGKKYVICEKNQFLKEVRFEGGDYPAYAETMVGVKRLENIEFCVKQILTDAVPGDLIETGVWRGGVVIFMKALLNVNGVTNRVVWVADSFAGLPKPNEEKYAADQGDKHYTKDELVVSLEDVQNNFKKYGLLDENVRFLKGWFKDTLPVAPIQKLALVRLDGDMYESTMDGLVHLYPKLSPGGYLIVDDWGSVAGCKKAVEDYRAEHGITEEIIPITATSVYWRKRADAE